MHLGLNLSLSRPKFGSAGIDYSLNGVDFEMVADFENDYFRKASAATTFADLFTHSRASTAIYTDSNGHHQTASSGVARTSNHIYNGSAWVKAGYLHEPARTNLIATSNDLSGWSGGLVDTSGQSTGPDGTASMTKLADDNAGGSSSLFIDIPAVTVTTSTVHVLSFYARADQLDWIVIRPFNFTTPASGNTFFNINTGTVGTVSPNHDAAGIEGLGGGLYRCWLRFTTDAADTTGQFRIYLSEDGISTTIDRDGTSSIFVSGFQLEAGYFPSSYIPTTGSTVTRAADSLSIAAANLPWNASARTYTLKGTMTYADEGHGTQITFLNQSVSASDRIIHYLDTSSTRTGSVYLHNRVGGATVEQRADAYQYSEGQDVAFNFASRHTASALNLGVDGNALTESATTGLADLSTADLSVVPAGFAGNVGLLRVAGADIGDVGLGEI